MEQNPPMVGREREQEQLLGILGNAMSGEGALVLIAGEAGVGKTRLCDEFEKRALSLDCEVLVGRCIPGVPSPYLPFQEALSSYSPSNVHLDGIFGNRAGNLSPRSESDKTLLSCLEFLDGLTKDKVVVLRLEDLHWADSQTAQMLHFLARNVAGLRLVMVGTIRTEETGPGPAGTVHPMVESLRLMRREGICTQLDLPPLSQSEVGQAVTGMLGLQVDAGLLDDIARESAGNPLFLVELVRMLAATGKIVQRDGIWVRTGEGPMDIPTTVREVVLHRLDLIGREQRRTLDLASVIGETFEPKLIAKMTGRTDLDVLETLEQIEDDHRLIVSGAKDFRFAHQKVQRVIYEEISPLRRRELHRVIGLNLESDGPDDATVARLVMYFEQAGENSRLAKYAVRAGENCLRKYSLREAGPFFEKAVSANQFAQDKDILARSLEGLGDIAAEAGECERALAHYDRLLNVQIDSGWRARVLRKEAEIWMPTVKGKGDTGRTTELLEEAERYDATTDPVDRAYIKMDRADIAFLKGDPESAIALAREAEAIIRKHGAREKLGIALSNPLMALMSLGRLDEAEEKLAMAIPILTEANDVSVLSHDHFQMGIIHWHRGEHAKALESLDKANDLLRKLDFAYESQLCWNHFYAGLVHQSAREFGRSLDEAEAAQTYCGRFDSGYVALGIEGVRLHALLQLGRAEEALDLCKEMRRMSSSFKWEVKTPIRGLNHAMHAEMLARNGEFGRSDVQFQKALDAVDGGVHSILMTALISSFWGECLARRGERIEAKERFGRSIEQYGRLGNRTQILLMGKLMDDLGV